MDDICKILIGIIVLLVVVLIALGAGSESYSVKYGKDPIVFVGKQAPIKLGWIDYPSENFTDLNVARPSEHFTELNIPRKSEHFTELNFAQPEHFTDLNVARPSEKFTELNFPQKSEKYVIKNGKYTHGKVGMVDEPSMRCGFPSYGQPVLLRNVVSYPSNY